MQERQCGLTPAFGGVNLEMLSVEGALTRTESLQRSGVTNAEPSINARTGRPGSTTCLCITIGVLDSEGDENGAPRAMRDWSRSPSATVSRMFSLVLDWDVPAGHIACLLLDHAPHLAEEPFSPTTY